MRKQQFLRHIYDGLKREWTPLEGPLFGTVLVQFKKLNGLILQVGIEFSRLYEQRFTCSFFLSRSFHWAYILPGFPNDAYRRIGSFLTESERKKMLTDEYLLPGVIDAWWVGMNSANCELLLEAIDLACPRFLNQRKLAERVWECQELQRHVDMTSRVAKIAHDGTDLPGDFIFQPTKKPKEIPSSWYLAAEIVLRDIEPKLISKKYVCLLAVDAWRLHNL